MPETSTVLTVTPSPATPFAEAVRQVKERLKVSWSELQKVARQAGVRVDFFHILRGRVPPPEEVAPLATVLHLPAKEVAQLLEVSKQHWAQRRNDREAKAVERGQRAVCRKCGKTAPVAQVRHRNAFSPAKGAEAASFVHRACRGRPGQVTLICEVDGCMTPPRHEYWSAKKKRNNRSRRVPGKKNTYSVPCRKHHPGARKARLRKKQEELRERRFAKLFNAEYPEGLLYNSRRYPAHDLWVAVRAGVPEGRAIKARAVRKALFSKAMKSGSSRIIVGLFPHSQSMAEETRPRS